MADMFHPWSMSTIVVRKMIPTKPFFYFFGGNMPITREVRIFVKDGQIESVHPYWPEEAFYGIEDNKELQEKVKALNTFTEDDKKLFFIAGNLLAKSFPGYWSVDFLQDADGEWICIDMAVGETSYKNSESIDIN